jgi:hypothetical protein
MIGVATHLLAGDQAIAWYGADAQMVQQYRPVEYTATPVVVPPR